MKLLEEIVQRLADEHPDQTDIDELKRLLKAGKLLEVADHCKVVLGSGYNEVLSERLRGGTGTIPDPHAVIVKLPFSAIVTTNYDKLLERSYASVGSLPKTPTHRDVDALGPLLFDRSFFILKAHGDIDRPESMVLTTRDYQEIIHANPAFNSVFSAILLTKAVLFVGYSINDPDFRLLLDRQLTVFRGNVPDRYALMSGVGRVERDVLLRTARIHILSYDDGQHEQMLEFLRELQTQVEGAAAVAAPAPAAEPVLEATVGGQRRVSVDLKVLRPPALTEPTLTLRIRSQKLEANLVADDVSVQGVGASADWMLVRSVLSGLPDETRPTRVGQQLASWLPATVLDALAEIEPARVVTLRLSPEVELLPWEWLRIGGTLLALRHPVVRSPVGLSDNARGRPMVAAHPSVLLIGDPNRGDRAPLPGALAETKAIAHVYRTEAGIEPRVLLGPEANFEQLEAEFAATQYDVVHFAGHAWFDETEPYLFLAGETKLRSTEFRSLLSPRPPAILFLNSHYTIFTPPGASSEGSPKHGGQTDAKPNVYGQRGFIDAASTAGVGALIGTFAGSLDDETARDVGVRFHQSLIAGQPVAQSMHDAIVAGDVAAAERNESRVSYGVSGYGDLVLPPAKRSQ
jgi:hypothetical protein